jgi:hypothetical protein
MVKLLLKFILLTNNTNCLFIKEFFPNFALP